MITTEKGAKSKWSQKEEKKVEEELPGNVSDFSLFLFLHFSSFITFQILLHFSVSLRPLHPRGSFTLQD
jgi:hypothetical protein